ncbi:MAG: helix-turn-helix transcriptional regulator [Oscillospiraceae bacterium]|nr:helix-turn-helix domain-containing protein [Collinsella sp.]MDY3079012.1 helix-turn-helix transcriptional regulator [Oscillospiraceae bacterium]
MTDTELLRKKIKQSGYKIQFIAKKLGISYQGLLNKINNKSEFRAKEIQILHDLLNLTEDERVAIFFTRE